MKRFLLGLLLTLLLLPRGISETGEDAEAPSLPCHDTEYSACEQFLASGKVKLEDQNFIRFFTTFAVPEKYTLRDDEVPLRTFCEHALSFTLNSCASINSAGNIEKPKRVPGSTTLWYVDIRDYGWKEEDIDAVFKLQPYFLTPLVEGANPNIMFRADWFLSNAMDTTRQDDRGVKDFPYYILQYGKGNEPKNAADFQKAWLVDIKTIRQKKLETGTIIDAGDSGVSVHTRQLRRGRTVLGYYWETRDVKSHELDPDKIKSRDYLEDLFANQADAGEYIATGRNGMQVYLLTAGNNQDFKRVEAGDTGIVVDRLDPDDVRVRTAKSCVVCHANGIIPYSNAIREFFKSGGNIFAKDKELAREIKAFYLKYQGEELEQDNAIFEKAVKECNGLDTTENAKQFLAVYKWYNAKVIPEQAAVECGLVLEDYRKNIKPVTSGRLAYLYKGKAMPRDVWDSTNNGGYVQSVLLIKRLDKKAQDALEQIKGEAKGRGAPAYPAEVVVSVEWAPVVDANDNILVYLGNGVRVTVLSVFDANWYYVRHGQVQGYLQKSHAR